MGKGKLIFLALMLAVPLSNLFAQSAYDVMLKTMYEHTVPLIKVEEVDTSANTVFLDAREIEEYETSHISGARYVGYDKFSKKAVKDLPKDSEIIVYCSVGYRSERIGEKLQDMGFTSVKNLYGGVFQWKNEGKAVVDDQNQPTDTVHTYNRLWSVWLKNGVKKYD